MNSVMVKRLVAKDWHFFRHLVMLYIVGALIGLAMMSFGSGYVGMIGSIGTVTVIISLGCHLVMSTVVNERKEGTLPFVMSLPISVREYTLSKMVANLSIFLVLWLSALAAMIYMILASTGFPNGILPMFLLLMVELFIVYLVLLAVALISESEGWTIVAMVICNTSFSIVAIGLGKMEGIGGIKDNHELAWTSDASLVLGVELALIVAIVGATFFFQNRKTDFL